MILLATLVFTAMFLITLFIVGPFIGGVEMEEEVYAEQPASFTIEKNTLFRTNQTKEDLILHASGYDKSKSINDTIQSLFEKRALLYRFEDSGNDMKEFVFEIDGTYGQHQDEFDEVLEKSTPGTPRPILLPEGRAGSTIQLFTEPEELNDIALRSLTY